MDHRGTSGEVFDSNAFDTNAFDVNSWDFGEDAPVEEPLGGTAGIWINQRQEEDDIMVIINTFLTMKH